MNFSNVYFIIFVIVDDFISVSVEEGVDTGVWFVLGDLFDPLHNWVWYWEFIEISSNDALPSIEKNKIVGALEISIGA